MTTSESTIEDVLAPIDFIVVEFPDGAPSTGGFEKLRDLVDRNVIRILDVEFVQKDGTGVRSVSVSELPAQPGVDLREWAHASSGLLDLEDFATIGAEIGENSLAMVVVFENVWVLDLVDSWSKSRARLVLDGAISADDLLEILDAEDTN